MKKLVFLITTMVLCVCLAGCGGEDKKRVKALSEMPVLWQSEIIIADPDMPDMEEFAPMYDSYDATLAQAWTKDKFTEDYIPESVMAFRSKSYRDKPRTVTIHMGDTVDVLMRKTNNTGKEVCLVRTQDNTYCWLYAFHLYDKDGERIGVYND